MKFIGIVLANSRKKYAMKKIILFVMMVAAVSTSFAQKKKSTKNTKSSYKNYVASVEKKTKKATDTLQYYSKQEDSIRLATDSVDLVLLDSTRQVWLDSMYASVDSASMLNAGKIYSNQSAREQKEAANVNELRKYKLSSSQLTRLRTINAMYYDEVELIEGNENMMEVERTQKLAELNQSRDLKIKSLIGSKNYKKWTKNKIEEPTSQSKEN